MSIKEEKEETFFFPLPSLLFLLPTAAAGGGGESFDCLPLRIRATRLAWPTDRPAAIQYSLYAAKVKTEKLSISLCSFFPPLLHPFLDSIAYRSVSVGDFTSLHKSCSAGKPGKEEKEQCMSGGTVNRTHRFI